jgi:hypothetical protein
VRNFFVHFALIFHLYRYTGEVTRVNTHGRLAKVDGRFPHWVRGYEVGLCRLNQVDT